VRKMIPLPLELFPLFERSTLGVPPWDPLPELPPAVLPSECDVVIVGAGITGLSAAAAAARAGRHVVVLERSFGTGATARSGGVVLGETVEGPDPEFKDCEDVLRRWIQESGTDCDLRWQGCLELARDARLSTSPIDWHDGGTVRLVARVPAGVLNPAKLQMALLESAAAAGATIVDGATVSEIRQSGSGMTVSMEYGNICARAGIMAVDAMCWRRGFDPWWKRVMTVSLQTAPVAAADLSALGLNTDEAFYTADTPLLWGRVMPDLSLLVGRETLPFPERPDPRALSETLAIAAARLASRVRGLHPAIATIPIQRTWTGPLARTPAGHPTIAADPFVPTLVWAGGYGGQGIAQGFALGRRAAAQILAAC
jgi:glycine/D-amino acid oxidase-like deaminating enzyme